MGQRKLVTHRDRPYRSFLAWRSDLGLSQKQAASLLHLSQTQYSRLERRRQFARGTLAKQILKTINIPLAVVVGVD